jgi:eukaryotic-like serine/threonine-protein kinase
VEFPITSHWPRLSVALDELLDLNDVEQARRLRALEAEQPALAHQLRLLLESSKQRREEDFLGGSVMAHLNPTGTQGQRIGAYVIEKPLGQGGTASVWRARRADGLFEEPVAIKLQRLSGRVGAARFDREGMILARLTHPHIAGLLATGVTPDGQSYLVLELVDGQSLDRHCDELRLTVAGRLRLLEQVLSAVGHAHSHLVVHCDIKPSNILVSTTGQAKLLDFGIAQLLDNSAGSMSEQHTDKRHRVMTPRYAAPEQLRGQPTTTATDIYALGVLTYELLCGRSPLGTVSTANDVLRATLQGEPPRMTDALMSGPRHAPGYATARAIAAKRGTSPAGLRRELQGDLQDIVALALRKEPMERFTSASAFAAEIRRYLEARRGAMPASSLPGSPPLVHSSSDTSSPIDRLPRPLHR